MDLLMICCQEKTSMALSDKTNICQIIKMLKFSIRGIFIKSSIWQSYVE